MSFVGELRRRNVFRVGVAYIVTAWLLLQIADTLLDAVGSPDWVMPTLLGLCGLSVPAWVQGQDCSAAARMGEGPLPQVQLVEMHNNPRWKLDYLD